MFKRGGFRVVCIFTSMHCLELNPLSQRGIKGDFSNAYFEVTTIAKLTNEAPWEKFRVQPVTEKK